MIDNGLSVDLGTLYFIVTRNEVDELCSEFLCESFNKFTFTVNVTAVTDDTAETHTALCCIAGNTL